jgi:hypothetical protein
MEDQQQQVNSRVEQDVRLLIGDLHVQLIVARNMLNVIRAGTDTATAQPESPVPPQPRSNGDARPSTTPIS